MRIGILGGTGPEGKGLAVRWALAGEEVLIGSRDATRAHQAVQEVLALCPGGKVHGMLNSAVAQQAEVVVVAVPYEGQKETLTALRPSLAGKILVDVVAPLTFIRGRARAVLVPEGSAAQQAQAVVPEARVVAAFHTISAHDLLHPPAPIPCDVLVCADDAEAKRTVMALAERIPGVRAVDANGLECARYVEEMVALLLNINRIYKGSRSMVRIVGLVGAPPPQG
ncbi:MAG: NADPH-dependent F420 reductase [Dehalococcoidia bacterium]|nr:NADPH-dependent F420 reductase [Dehalococcoidia bacterium]MDW8120262.1 NADPH-dependent F420 reductase [Chloroflexota bacterium]